MRGLGALGSEKVRILRREISLCVAVGAEQAVQLHVIGVQQLRMYDEAADKPGDEQHQPGEQKFLVH